MSTVGVSAAIRRYVCSPGPNGLSPRRCRPAVVTMATRPAASGRRSGANGVLSLTCTGRARRFLRLPSGSRSRRGIARRLGHCPRRPRRVLEVDADRRVGLERAPQAELLADVAERRQYFLPQQADARLGVLAGHEAVGGPEAHDGWPRLLEEPAQLGNDRLRRAGDDLLILV